MLKTKIVCTLGPSSNSPEMIEKMISSGMNVARLNFSHGTHEGHAEVIRRIKAARDKLGVPVAIMLDTKGPEIRLCKFKGGEAELRTGSTFTLTTDGEDGDDTHVSVTYKDLPTQVKPNVRILLNDGALELTVRETTPDSVVCTVTCGGTIKDGKGVNIPNVHLDM
ncbi:MAG: pyruvate kinase, partial [Selenomonadales bacterium]|nr:pyruvate kinase [Selenomonadales bacterium]